MVNGTMNLGKQASMSSPACTSRPSARLLLLTSFLSASVLSAPLGKSAHAAKHAALVIDGNSGRVISEQSADEPRYPASLTKMMTIYVVFELIEQKKLTYDTKIVFSDQATRVQPTKLDVKAGDSITVMDAVKALITKSANDASVALAEHIAGSEAKFAALMTQTARRIGMNSSTFKNAHGLPHAEQVTTARDMITLGLRLQDDFPKHYPLFATTAFNFRGDTHKNHNTLLLSYEGTDGIKTGYIGSSGFNLVANVRRDGKHVIGVVFGGASAAARNQNMRTLLNIGMIRGATTKTRKPDMIARAAKPLPNPAAASRPVQVATALTAQPAPSISLAPQKPVPPTAETKIQVATVKPVLVAPRQPMQAAAVPQFTTTFAPTPAATQTLTSTPQPIERAQRTPPAAPAKSAQAQVPILTPPLASASAQPRQQVAARSNLAGPITQPTAATGPYQIQVGAFATEADARRQIDQVKAQTGALLAAFPSLVVASTANGKTVYRARYSGFDTTNGGNICNELRRRQIDCMVAKAE